MNLYCILYNISISIINITIHRIINVIIVMAIMLFDHFLRFQLFVVVIISDNEGDVFFCLREMSAIIIEWWMAPSTV